MGYDGYLKIGTDIDTNSFDAQIDYIKAQMEEIEYLLKQVDSGELDGIDVTKLEAKYEKLSNTLNKLIQKKQEFNNEELEDVENDLGKINKRTNSIIENIGRWALAVFGIRTAYNFIRQSVTTLSQYNKQLATDLEYIRFAVASSLQPVIETVVSWVYKLLSYVNYLAKAWFGINLFANATAKAMNKTASSAKETKKALAGFDEMNVISSNSTSTQGAATPSFDLSSDKDTKIPEWLQWIEKNGKTILYLLIGIAGALLLFKLAPKGGEIDKTGKSISNLTNAIGNAAGIIAVLGGLALVLSQLGDFIKDFAESGLTLKDVGLLLGIVLIEIAAGFTALAAASKLMDWTGIAGAAVILAGFSLVLASVTKLIKQFSQSGMTLGDVIGLLSTILLTIVGLMTSVVVLGPLMTAGLVPFSIVMVEIAALLGVMALTLPIILDACSDFINDSAPGITKVLTAIGILIENIIYAIGTVLPPIIESVGEMFNSIFSGISKVISTVGNTIVKILNTVKSLITTVLNSILNFINKLGPAINKFVDNAIKAVTKLINFMISGIEYLVNTLVINGVNKIIKAINSIAEYVGISIPTVSKLNIPRFVPKLASGGIINMPGKGVPLGGAIGGEAGREGVIPLTNSQAMEELGSAIGRYITINLTNNTQLDGRTIARHQSIVQANRNFAMNR